MASPAPLRGNNPAPRRPLPSLDMGARLGADQARDRFLAREAANDNASGPANDNGVGLGEDDSTFLDPGVRSYTRSEETEAEQERTRQAGMMRTQRQFLTPDGERLAQPQAPAASAKRVAQQEEEEEAIEAEDDAAAREEEAMAQAMAMAAALDREQLVASRRRAAAEQAQSAISKLETVAKASKGIRRIVKVIQLALAETFVPLITLFLQMNAEFLNKWIFRVNIPVISPQSKNRKPDIDDVLTGGVDCLACCSCVLLLLLLSLAVVIIWIYTNPLDAISLGAQFIADLFAGK